MGAMTITTTAQQDARIVAAFGKYLGLPGNATAAQVKAEVIAFVKITVFDQERRAAVAAATATAEAGVAPLGSVT